MKLLISLWILLFSIISFSKGNSEPVDSKAIEEMKDIIQMRIGDIKELDSKLSNAENSEKSRLKIQLGDKISSYLRSVSIYRTMTGNKLDYKLSKQINEMDVFLKKLNSDSSQCQNADGSKMEFKPSYGKKGSDVLDIESNCPGCYISFDEIIRDSTGETTGSYNTTNYIGAVNSWSKLDQTGNYKLELFGVSKELKVFFNPQMCCQFKNPSTCVRRKSIILWNDKTKETKIFSDVEDFNKRSGHKLNCQSQLNELTKCSFDNVDVKSSDYTNKERVLYKRNLNAQ